jgi:hypothetical protein
LWLPVYVAPPPALSKRQQRGQAATHPGLKAKRVGWRCFFKTGQGVNVAIELEVRGSVRVHHEFQQGEFIERTFKRLKASVRNERLQRQGYTARLLFVPSLYFSALWFSGNRSQDLFVSLVTLGREVKTGLLYTRREIVAALGIEKSRREAAHQSLLARKNQVFTEQADEKLMR